MFGLLKDLATKTGEVVGTVAGIALTPVALALEVSEAVVRRAVEAGCRTQHEIREWIDENT